jgi:hypothetical protein
MLADAHHLYQSLLGHLSPLASNVAFAASRLSSGRSGFGRGCVKTKTDLVENQFCEIQTSKSRRFESRLGFLARFAQFAKVPSVFTASARSGN